MDQDNIEPDGMDEVMAAQGSPTDDSMRPTSSGPMPAAPTNLDYGKHDAAPNNTMKLLGAGQPYMNRNK